MHVESLNPLLVPDTLLTVSLCIYIVSAEYKEVLQLHISEVYFVVISECYTLARYICICCTTHDMKHRVAYLQDMFFSLLLSLRVTGRIDNMLHDTRCRVITWIRAYSGNRTIIGKIIAETKQALCVLQVQFPNDMIIHIITGVALLSTIVPFILH